MPGESSPPPHESTWYHADGNANSVPQRNVAQILALGAYVDPKTDASGGFPKTL